jgi:hypothetical protein
VARRQQKVDGLDGWILSVRGGVGGWLYTTYRGVCKRVCRVSPGQVHRRAIAVQHVLERRRSLRIQCLRTPPAPSAAHRAVVGWRVLSGRCWARCLAAR